MVANHGVKAVTQSAICTGVGAGNVVVGDVVVSHVAVLGLRDNTPTSNAGTAAIAEIWCREIFSQRETMKPLTKMARAATMITSLLPVVGSVQISVANMRFPQVVIIANLVELRTVPAHHHGAS